MLCVGRSVFNRRLYHTLHVLVVLSVDSESYAQLLVEGSLTCKYATTFNVDVDTDFTTLLARICFFTHFTGWFPPFPLTCLLCRFYVGVFVLENDFLNNFEVTWFHCDCGRLHDTSAVSVTACRRWCLMYPRNIVDFGIIQIVCVCVHLITCFLLLLVTCFFFLLLIFSFLIHFSFIFSFKNRPTPFPGWML